MQPVADSSVPLDRTETSNVDDKEQTHRRDFADSSSMRSQDDARTIENAELGHRATYINTGEAAGLPQEHRDWLIAHHGTLDLDPIPDMTIADPYNWAQGKKVCNLVLVAFQAMMGTFTAAAIIPAYETLSEEFGTTTQNISYLTSLQIAILGVAPLFWKPLSNRYGRRPIWFISFICSCLFNVGCALSNDYTTMAVCRAFGAFFISPASAIGTGVVTETFFKRERGKYIGIWTIFVTLGVPLGPFIFGFVSLRVGWRWIYWVLAIVNGVQLFLSIFLQPETRYIRRGVQHRGSAFKQEYMQFGRIDPNPFKFWEFVQPLTLFRYISIAVPTIAYAMVFLVASVMMTVEIPQLFIPKFGFNSQQIGLQFLGVIIGTIIGEQLGGALSDTWMRRRSKVLSTRQGHDVQAEPEFRLWLSYFGFILVFIGEIVFLVRLQQAPQGHWNVTPIVGIAFAACGNQIITTVLVTYAIDSHPEQASSIGVFVNFVRQVWGFIGPFWFPSMFDNVGLAASAGVVCALVAGASVIPTIWLQWRGQHHREKKVEKLARKEEERQAVADAEK